jgi:hypothetical protein
VRALAVRARSRVSESAVHACGRRDRKMRSDRRTALRTIQLRASVPRVLLARRCFGLTRRSSLVPRLAPRARPPRCAPANRPLEVAFAASRARTPEGSGPADAERGQGNARFTTREPPGESLRPRVGSVRPLTRATRLRPGCLCRLLRERSRSGLHRTGSSSKAAEIDSLRTLVKAARTSSTRDTFHRQDRTRRAHATNRAREPCRSFEPPLAGTLSGEERSREVDRPSLEAPSALSRRLDRLACATRRHRRRAALRWVSSASTEPPFTFIRRERPSFRLERRRWPASLSPKTA